MSFDRIVTDPGVLAGEPHIAGTSISVNHIAVLWINGFTPEEIVGDFPELTVEDVEQALAWDGATEQF